MKEKKKLLIQLYELLYRSYKPGKDDEALAGLAKSVFYEKNGDSIIERLKKRGFSIEKYFSVELILFLFTYILLKTSSREILDKKRNTVEFPNKKMLFNIDRMNIDTNIVLLEVYFFVLSDTYEKLCIDSKNEKELMEKFKEHLIFQNRGFEDYGIVERKDGWIQLSEIEGAGLSKIGDIYDNAYLRYLSKQELLLQDNLNKIYECSTITFSYTIACFLAIVRGGYLLTGMLHNTIEREDYFLIYTDSMNFLCEAYGILYLKMLDIGNTGERKLYEKEIEDVYNILRIEISRIHPFIKNIAQNNIFGEFAFYVHCLSCRERYGYIQKVSDYFVSMEEKNDLSNSHELDNKIFSEEEIDKCKTKKLLEYILSDVKQRKPNDRNVIKKRLKYLLKLLNYLSVRNPVFGKVHNGKQLKIMYLFIYENDEMKFSVNKMLPKRLYDGKKTELTRSEITILTEMYIRNIFVSKGCKDEYEVFQKKRKVLMAEFGKKLRDMTKFMDD